MPSEMLITSFADNDPEIIFRELMEQEENRKSAVSQWPRQEYSRREQRVHSDSAERPNKVKTGMFVGSAWGKSGGFFRKACSHLLRHN